MKIRKTPEVKKLLDLTFPEYKGRKFYLRTFEGPQELRSFWDEGSRTYYKFVNTGSLQVHELHSNHPMFEPSRPNRIEALPPGVVLVSNAIYAGVDAGVTFWVRPDEYPKWLAGPVDKSLEGIA